MECATCHRDTLQMRLTATFWDEKDRPVYVEGQTFTVEERLPGDLIRATDHQGEHRFDLEYCEFGRWETGPNPNFQVWKSYPAPTVCDGRFDPFLCDACETALLAAQDAEPIDDPAYPLF